MNPDHEPAVVALLDKVARSRAENGNAGRTSGVLYRPAKDRKGHKVVFDLANMGPRNNRHIVEGCKCKEHMIRGPICRHAGAALMSVLPAPSAIRYQLDTSDGHDEASPVYPEKASVTASSHHNPNPRIMITELTTSERGFSPTRKRADESGKFNALQKLKEK